MLVVEIIGNAAAAVVVWLTLLALGARLRVLLRLPAGGSLRWSVDLSLGALAVAVAILLLGLVGLSRTWLQVAVLVVAGLAGTWRTRRPWAPLLAGLLGSLLFLPIALGPPFFYDAFVYHLGLPWQALIEGGWHAHPESLFSTFPPLAQLLSMPFLSVQLFRAPAMLHWLVWVTAVTPIFTLTRRVGVSRATACLAVVAGVLLPDPAVVSAFPAAEAWFLVALMPAVTLGVGTNRRSLCVLAGLLCGVATSARLQGLPWSLLILLIILIRFRRSWPAPLAAAGGWWAGALPWWLKNSVLLGDPFAPIFWSREGMETLWRDSHSMLKAGVSLAAIVESLPQLLSPHLSWALPLLVLVATAVLFEKRARLLGVATFFGILAWPATGALPRFLTAACWLLVSGAAGAAGALRSRLLRLAVGAVMLWCAIVGARSGVQVLRTGLGLDFLLMDTIEASTKLSINDPLPAFVEAAHLPGEARVLFIAEPRGFLFPRRFIAPSQHDVNPLRPVLETSNGLGEVLAFLHDRGVTHILVNRGELDRLGTQYPVKPWRTTRGRQMWNSLITSLGDPVVERNGVVILQTSPRR